MEPGAVFRPTYKGLHRDFAARITRCKNGIAALKNQEGVYAEELRRCLRTYRRIMEAIEEDQP